MRTLIYEIYQRIVAEQAPHRPRDIPGEPDVGLKWVTPVKNYVLVFSHKKRNHDRN